MKVEKRQRPGDAVIVPRAPGLDTFTYTDAGLVERARRDLEQLLRDPYYREAIVEIKREKPMLLQGRRGRRGTAARGAWAAEFQGEINKKQSARPGRPATAAARARLMRLVADALIQRGAFGMRSYMDFAIALARSELKGANASRINRRKQEIAQQIYNASHNLKKSR